MLPLLSVTFSDTSAPLGVAGQWLWTFGDRESSSAQSPAHLYRRPGLYVHTQCVTDTATGEWDVWGTPDLILVGQVITYTYDPLGRLIDADYSRGERYAYQYDAVGNRLAFTTTTPLSGTTVTTYTYDAANRLVNAGGVAYTWDQRGNLTHDGVLTYTYDAAGRMVRVQGITTTVFYTYNTDGLRVAQSAGGAASPFAWDWASGIPGLLTDGDHLYLLGHETLGQWDGAWSYYLPDALGSVRQTVDGSGAVVGARAWDPFGVEVGGAQGGPGYTGEWFDDGAGLLYLRARWYEPKTGGFTQPDPREGDFQQPQTLHPYTYVHNDPVNYFDPAGQWREPTWQEQQSIKLNAEWSAPMKPRCCRWSLNPCMMDDTSYEPQPVPSPYPSPCPSLPRFGVPIRSNTERFQTPEDYIRYWLAWEYIANPCFYRQEANCMGAALELSSLYTGPWASKEEVFQEPYYNPSNGYGNPIEWPGFLEGSGEDERGYFLQSVELMIPGTIIAFTPYPNPFGVPSNYPSHFVVQTALLGLYEGGMCFEKQSPTGHYQLRPCHSIGLERPLEPTKYFFPSEKLRGGNH